MPRRRVFRVGSRIWRVVGLRVLVVTQTQTKLTEEKYYRIKIDEAKARGIIRKQITLGIIVIVKKQKSL